MNLTELIPVASLTVNMLKSIARVKGWDVQRIDENYEMVQSILLGVQQSGKYSTLGDVLADEELVNGIVSLFAGDSRASTTVETDTLSMHMDSTMTCPKCGHISTLRILKKIAEEK